MIGTLAQQLSLISYGNHYFRTGELPADYYPHNPAFKFCNQVTFSNLVEGPGQAPPTEAPAAPDPVAWLRLLRQQNCRRLSLCYRPSPDNALHTPDYQLAGFVGGGGQWLLEANAGASSDYWAGRWEVTRPQDPDQLIWGVSYVRVAVGLPPAAIHPPLPPLRAQLVRALTDIQAFATTQKLENWVGIFGRALATLDNPVPAQGFYETLLVPAEHPLAARQLIFAASAAWVFGGMGSWNDLGFEDAATQRRYEELSAQLYAQVNSAIVAGINASV